MTHREDNTPNQVHNKVENAPLVAALKVVLARRGVSMRQLSDDLKIPYRSIQNYLSGESRLPADVLLSICTKLGIESDYLLKGTFQLSHFELFDAVKAALGDAISDLDLDPSGKIVVRDASTTEASKQLSVVHILTAKINEAYDRYRNEWLEKGVRPPITSADFIRSVKRPTGR